MDRILWFFKNVRLQPINNQKGHLTTLYEHFIREDEKTRLERDTKSKETSYSNTHRIMSFRFMPQLVKSEENLELLQEFFKLTEQYIQLSNRVLKPCRCFCRRTSCGCCFTSIFGENKQMGEVLATTFDGQHLWIKNNKNGRGKTKIDAMFFPATSEKFDKANLKAEKNFKKLPTFILCNPNAMFY